MEKIEENVVTKGAKPAEPMQKMAGGEVEDLGGPTPENYKPDDDSAKLKTPGATLKQVKDVVNKGAKPAEAGKGMKEEEVKKNKKLLIKQTVSLLLVVRSRIKAELS